MSEIAEKLSDFAFEAPSATIENDGPRFNIAPTQNNLVLRRSFADPKTLQAAYLRWGLVPSWSKTPQTQSPMINARSETVADKPSFRGAFQRRRCLVPADGFYEWKRHKGANLPYHFSLVDESIFFMAGIWETWVGEHNQQLESYTILTTQANTLMAKYHERMPVILSDEKVTNWLEADFANISLATRNEIFSPISADRMSCRPANPIVNNNRSEGEACLEEPSEISLSQLDLGL